MMARLYAKYRCLKATIRVESAVPTSAGGQYAVFYDPNPANNWQEQNAVEALTSMPVQDVAAAWECLKLVIPPAQLQRSVELYTEDLTSETLVTRVGQVVLLNLANSVTTPPGGATVTVWLDATWEFYEPNASSELSLASVVFDAGAWHVSGNQLTVPTHTPPTTTKTVYELFPELPSSMFSQAVPCRWMAKYAEPALLGFETRAAAVLYAQTGSYGDALTASATPSSTQPKTVGVVTDRFSPSIQQSRQLFKSNLN